MKNEIIVKLFGKEYCLMTDETKEYTEKLVKDLNQRLAQLMNSKTMMSQQDAVALIALEAYEELTKLRESGEDIRDKVKAYADEAEAQLFVSKLA